METADVPGRITLNDHLESAVLEFYMAGLKTPRQITEKIAAKKDSLELHEEFYAQIKKIMDSKEFLRAVMEVNRDAVGSVITRFKRSLHKYANILDECATQTTDQKVRFNAAVKILGIAGATDKGRGESVSPMDYIELLKSFAKQKEMEDGVSEAGNTDEAPGFILSTPGGPAKGGN